MTHARLPAAPSVGCSCRCEMPRASPGTSVCCAPSSRGRRVHDCSPGPTGCRWQPPCRCARFSTGTPHGFPHCPRDEQEAGAAFVGMSARVAHSIGSRVMSEMARAFEPEPRGPKQGADRTPRKEHGTRTADNRRRDGPDRLRPGRPPRRLGLRDVAARCAHRLPSPRRDSRSDAFPGAIRQAIPRALARAVITARGLPARSGW